MRTPGSAIAASTASGSSRRDEHVLHHVDDLRGLALGPELERGVGEALRRQPVALVGADEADADDAPVAARRAPSPRRRRARRGRGRRRRGRGGRCRRRGAGRRAGSGAGASAGKPASVDGQDRAVDVLRRRRGEEDRGAGDVLGPRPSGRPGCGRGSPCCGRRRRAAPRCCWSRCSPGAMALTLMPLRRPLVGEQLGQPGDAVLGGGVGRDADAALEGEQRGDVDDRAAGPAREGGAGEGLARGRTPPSG